jgi:hypothetical protein
LGTRRIFVSSDTSWSSLCVIVVIHAKAGWGVVDLMVEKKPLSWTEDEIAEDEAPGAGVDNVIGKSYGCACRECGHDVDYVCSQCGHDSTT